MGTSFVTFIFIPLYIFKYQYFQIYYIQAEGVARGKKNLGGTKIIVCFKLIPTRGHPLLSTKFFGSFGPAVCPAIRNIYMNVLFYYIDTVRNSTIINTFYTLPFFCTGTLWTLQILYSYINCTVPVIHLQLN